MPTMPVLPTRARSRERAATPAPDVERSRHRFLRRVRARRWRLLRRVLLVLLVLAGAGLGVWLVFFSSVLAVQGTQVSGVAVLSEAQVEQAAAVPTGGPLATVDLDAVQARVEQLAPVASADVSRAWPDQVAVTVVERQAVVAVERDGQWQGADADGVLFRDYPQQPRGMPWIQMRAATSVEALSEAAQVVGALPDDLGRRVERLEVGSVDDIVLHLRDGDQVSWGSADQSEDKVRVLAVLLRQKGSRYDVTAPGRPTVRP